MRSSVCKDMTAWWAVQVTLQCLFSMSSHTLAVSCVRWGGDGLLYSASKDTTINVWDAQVSWMHSSSGLKDSCQWQTNGTERLVRQTDAYAA